METTNTTADAPRWTTSLPAARRRGRIFRHPTTAVGGTSQTYDANGNVTNNGTYKFKYNYKNLMCEVRLSANNNLVATYTYDANGRRIGRVVSGGITQRFICADVETIETFDGSNNWKQDFVFDVTDIDRVLMLEQADVLDEDGDSNTTELTRSYYHCNEIGSVVELSTANQTEGASYRYSPYGEATIHRGGSTLSSDPLNQQVRMSGRWSDEETSLVFCRARSLSCNQGRFLQVDPIGLRGGENLYEYVRSNPVNFRDPLGLMAMGMGVAFDAAMESMGRTLVQSCATGKCVCVFSITSSGRRGAFPGFTAYIESTDGKCAKSGNPWWECEASCRLVELKLEMRKLTARANNENSWIMYVNGAPGGPRRARAVDTLAKITFLGALCL